MSIEELRREVLASRRRSRRFWIIAAGVGLAFSTQLVVAAWLLRPRERVVHTTTVITESQIVTLPIALPIEREVALRSEPARCPMPRTDAPLVKPTRPDDYISAIRPSPTNAGWIAAWNETTIYISTDAGGSWQRRLDGTGTVGDVAFDCFGRVIAIRGDKLGIRDGNGERWQGVDVLRMKPIVDGEDEAAQVAILGGGPDIVLVGSVPGTEVAWNTRLAVSHDVGATWETRSLEDDWEGEPVIGRQYEDGTVRGMLPISDCGGDASWVFTYAHGVVKGDYDVDVNMAFYDGVIVASDGWKPIGATDVKPLRGVADYSVIVGPTPLVMTKDKQLYRVANGRATKVREKLSLDAREVVADAAGRVWSLECGQPAIATRAEAPMCDCDGP